MPKKSILTTFLGLLSASSLYAAVLPSAITSSSSVPIAESIATNPPVVDHALQSIQPEEMQRAADLESQASKEIASELAKQTQPIDPKV